MTIFYDSENEICSLLKDSFEFYDNVNLKSFSEILNKTEVFFTDDQIGFIVPSEKNDFPKQVKEFFTNFSIKADYFFALVVTGKRSSDSARKFCEICEKASVYLKYLDTVSASDSKRKIKDKGIAFRTEVGMFISRVKGIDLKNRILGIFEETMNFAFDKIASAHNFASSVDDLVLEPSAASESSKETD